VAHVLARRQRIRIKEEGNLDLGWQQQGGKALDRRSQLPTVIFPHVLRVVVLLGVLLIVDQGKESIG
jgi:hypothetical protein